MNEVNRALVRDSIERMESDINDVSQSFYRTLLLKHPEFSELFSGNVETLNAKFFNMIAVFKNVKHLEAISVSIEDVGRRHFSRYAVKPEHLNLIKPVLIQVLKEHFGNSFEQKVSDAWGSVFDEISELFLSSIAESTCIEGSYESMQEVNTGDGLLEEVGGRDVVLRVHKRFYNKVFEHPLLGQFFRGKHEAILARKQTDFMVAVFGGENRYTGDTPAFVHMHMYITQEQLELREELLRDSIESEGIGRNVADCWLNVDRRFWPGIAKKSVDECVLKCRGQIPIVAK